MGLQINIVKDTNTFISAKKKLLKKKVSSASSTHNDLGSNWLFIVILLF